jgi:hypothetical protein
MSLNAFSKLVDLLRKDIEPNERKSRQSTSGNEPVAAELVVATGLRYLGGASYNDLVDIVGVSNTHTKAIVRKFLYAVLNCKDLALKLPSTPEELQQASMEWQSISKAEGCFDGVVGAIDGWLCRTITPSKQDVPNPVDYFSGHYQCYGINVQAICDSKSRFIYVAVAAPGRTNDNRTLLRLTELQQWFVALPDQYFLVGDNAYANNKILIPFSGQQKQDESKRTYNFYLSQIVSNAYSNRNGIWYANREMEDIQKETREYCCKEWRYH